MSVKMNKEAFQKLIDDDILGLHETMRAGCVRDHIENILKDSARVYYDLAEAIEAVYFAAHWHADRTVDAAALWTALRDAAEIQPGQTKARLGEDRLPGPGVPLVAIVAARRALFAQHAPPGYADDCETCQHLQELDEYIKRIPATHLPQEEK